VTTSQVSLACRVVTESSWREKEVVGIDLRPFDMLDLANYSRELADYIIYVVSCKGHMMLVERYLTDLGSTDRRERR
jgi:predicted nucleic-acid-binding protein